MCSHFFFSFSVSPRWPPYGEEFNQITSLLSFANNDSITSVLRVALCVIDNLCSRERFTSQTPFDCPRGSRHGMLIHSLVQFWPAQMWLTALTMSRPLGVGGGQAGGGVQASADLNNQIIGISKNKKVS